MFWDALFPKKRQLVGLDIGSHSVKLVELGEGKKGARCLLNVGVAQLAPDAIVEGNIQNSEAIVEAIRQLVANIKPATRYVATSISGYSVIVKKIAVARATQEELEESIQWEAEQYIPFDINDVNIDFQILGTSPSNADQMDVMLVAAKKDIIDTYSGLLRSAGLIPAVIGVDSFAMGNAYELNYLEDPDTCTALIDIGAEKMNINIVKDGVPLLTRDASFGSGQITEHIQRHLNISYPEAENLKLTGSPDSNVMASLEGIYLSVLSAWVAEVERSTELFSATYPIEKIQRIFLSGGSAKVSGLPELLTSGTGLEVSLVDPFTQIEFNQKKVDREYLRHIGPQFAIGTGLALRRTGDR
ncbi:MAG: type IV pilus assembly protein PilM [Pseudomonadota bacterium]